MKKNIIKFILLFLLAFSYVSVFADANNKEHIYFVENLIFDDEFMTIEGYSFISHMDNYGRVGNKGNLTNYLVAYNGTDVNLNSDGTCNAIGGRCEVIKLGVKQKDLFWGRCGDGDNNPGGCTTDNHERYKLVSNDDFNFSNGMDEGNNCDVSESYCMYYNVGFYEKISLKSLVKDLYGSEVLNIEVGSGIKFKIFSYVKNNKSGFKKIVGSKLAVNTSFCKIEEQGCQNNKNFLVGNGLYSLRIVGVSNNVWFEAIGAAGQTEINGTISTYKYNGKRARFYHKGYIENNISLNSEQKTLYQVTEVKSRERKVWSGEIEDYFYKLKSLVINKPYSYKNKDGSLITGSYSIVPDNEINRSEYRIIDDDANIWTFANWVQSEGNLEITTFKPEYKELTCNNIKDKKNKSTNVTADCTNENKANGQFYECLRTKDPIVATVYIKLDKEPECGNKHIIANDGSIYLPVVAKSEVLLEQIGNFHFANFTPQTVKAGKGFSINYTMNNGIWYKNTFNWYLANVITKTNDTDYMNTPYISYSGFLPRLDSNGSCTIKDEDFVNDALKNAFKDPENKANKDKIYYLKDGKYVSANNTLNAVVNAFDIIMNSYSYYDTSRINNLKFSSCDSNSKSATCDKVDTVGLWKKSPSSTSAFIYGDVAFDNKYAHRGFGISKTNEFVYQLPYAYISLSDSANYKYADIVYSDSEIQSPATKNLRYIGNKYFVGFKYALKKSNGFDFPFNLDTSNASLVSRMTWNLTGTCGVNVEDGYYEFDNGCTEDNCNGKSSLLYNYRPISLKTPFPKANNSFSNIAINWIEWYNNNLNKSRINNMNYDNPDYEITLSKINGNSAVRISDINNNPNLGYYNELKNYGVDGTSGFVTDYFNDNKQISLQKSYCGLGFFSTRCDK